jgi:hypothetical protein
VIVRLMGEGQFRLPDELSERLNELDNRAQAAVEAEDEPALDRLLDEMWHFVQGEGERLPDDELIVSDAAIPPSDLTLEETRRLFSAEGLIPDLSA